MLDKYPTEWQNTPTQTWRCRGPGGSHRLQNGWGVARRGPWWVRLPYASATYFPKMFAISIASSEKKHFPSLCRNNPLLARKKSGASSSGMVEKILKEVPIILFAC